jgi:succinate-semialdehyde dehydrogenase/glutarate-semialdehyde dehydrogenase
MRDLVGVFIGGVWRPATGGKTTDIINPATEEPVGQLSMASPEDLAEALAAVQSGFLKWRNTPVVERCRLVARVGQLMRERVDTLSHDLTLEEGKPLGQARWEILATADYFSEAAATASNICGRLIPLGADGIRRSVSYEPIGPVFAVSPWNLPAMMPGRKIANTLAAGCSIIVKPAKETPITAFGIAKCCEDAGIPAGVINVLCGESSQISATMIQSSVIRKISFTGSTEVGKELARLAGASMKKMTMELGGHAPVIIFDDVDLPSVVEATVASRYSNAGQSCLAPTRFFVQQKIYREFVALFSERARGLQLGDGLDPQVKMGPLASSRRLEVMDRLVQDAVRKGATLTAGGSRLARKGYFYAPTVLADVPDGACIMTEEPFGPVTAIVSFTQTGAVIERANATPYGLGAYVFSRDLDRALGVVSQIDAGMVAINSMSVALAGLPFGGVKDSGVGREGSIDGLLESMVTKSISIGR